MCNKYFLLLYAWLLNPCFSLALEQRIYPGAFLHDTTKAVVLDSVSPEGMLYQVGLRKGDLIYSINGKAVENAKTFKTLTHPLRVPDWVQMDVLQGGKRRTLRERGIGRRQNTYTQLEVTYAALNWRNGVLRTIVYEPKHKGKHPAILILPGYNCSSIENFSRSYYRTLLEHWVTNGYVVYTVEKSGMGDSEGCLPCEQVDLETDISLYKAALKDCKQWPTVDAQRIYLWGHSMGGIIAPIVAQSEPVAGIMVYGTVFRPWHQFLLEMHRLQKPLLEKYTATETDRFIDTIQDIYYDFFVRKEPRETLVLNPKYTYLVKTELEYSPGNDLMWGRHWRFWQQIDSLNLNLAWRSLHVPVLILHGGADYIQCSKLEPKLLEEAVNTSRMHLAERHTIPDLDHLCMRSATYEEAVKNLEDKQFLKGNFHTGLLEITMSWLRKQP